MKPIAFKFLIAFLPICTSSNSIIAQEPTYLDGNSYTVNLTRLSVGKSGFPWKKDTFIFDSGKMHSVIMGKKEGFASALYYPSNSNTDQGSIIKFSYEHTNKYGSTLKIEGSAQGNVIEGTAKWNSYTYTFTGTLL